MDWTGGTRRRFAAGKNNAVIQKQKAHFAKARAARQNPGSSRHSFIPDFLQATSHPDVKRQFRDDSQRREGSHSHDGHGRSSRPVGNHGRRSFNGRTCETSGRQQADPRSPTVISISSRSGSSSSVSVASVHVKAKVHAQRQEPTRHVHDMNEEERLLLAKRRKLLARSDWLGLNMRRPINMRFPSAGDKDRVGKRRKVRSSTSRKAKPAAPRMMTPLFQPPLSPHDGKMRGPLYPDDIRIKIGTEALASQTQPSRQSHTPGRRSIRHPSTEFAPLSEESMLLGPDEDAFQSELLHGPTMVTPGAPMADNRSVIAIAGSQMTHGRQLVPEVAEMTYVEALPEHNIEYKDDRPTLQHAIDTRFFEPLSEPGHEIEAHMKPRSYASQMQLSRSPEDRSGSQFRPHHEAWVSTNSPAPAKQSQKSDDGDDFWKRFLGISQTASTHHSIVALKSSSLHVATSDSDQCRPNVERTPAHPAATAPMPMITGGLTEEAQIATTQVPDVHETLGSGSARLQSPSASLKQITRLAEQPAIRSCQAQQDAQDEALWRHFIVGSQDSSDDVAPYRDIVHEEETVESIEPVQTSSALAVSGLGTSVKSTVGDTLFVNTDTSSRVSEQVPQRKRRSKQSRNHVTLTIDATNSRHTLQALLAEEDDEIEDVELPPKRAGRANIHAGTTNILNHKRFKPPVKKATNLERRPSRFRAPRRTRTFVEADRSVYDLVDSDGVSLA